MSIVCFNVYKKPFAYFSRHSSILREAIKLTPCTHVQHTKSHVCFPNGSAFGSLSTTTGLHSQGGMCVADLESCGMLSGYAVRIVPVQRWPLDPQVTATPVPRHATQIPSGVAAAALHLLLVVFVVVAVAVAAECENIRSIHKTARLSSPTHRNGFWATEPKRDCLSPRLYGCAGFCSAHAPPFLPRSQTRRRMKKKLIKNIYTCSLFVRQRVRYKCILMWINEVRG